MFKENMYGFSFHTSFGCPWYVSLTIIIYFSIQKPLLKKIKWKNIKFKQACIFMKNISIHKTAKILVNTFHGFMQQYFLPSILKKISEQDPKFSSIEWIYIFQARTGESVFVVIKFEIPVHYSNNTKALIINSYSTSVFTNKNLNNKENTQ